MKQRWHVWEPRESPSGGGGGGAAGGGAGGELGRVKAWATGHKAIVGAGVVGLVALLAMRSRASSSAAADASGLPADATAGNPQGAAIAGYDSSANDIYNALQPQIEQTQGMLRKLLRRLNREDKKKHQGGGGGKGRKPPVPVGPSPPPRHHKPAHPPKHHKPTTPPGGGGGGTDSSGGGVVKPPTFPRLPPVGLPPAGRVTGPPAPIAAPSAVVLRRPTTLGDVGATAGVPLPAIVAANKFAPVATKLPTGTRITVPTRRRR